MGPAGPVSPVQRDELGENCLLRPISPWQPGRSLAAARPLQRPAQSPEPVQGWYVLHVGGTGPRADPWTSMASLALRALAEALEQETKALAQLRQLAVAG